MINLFDPAKKSQAFFNEFKKINEFKKGMGRKDVPVVKTDAVSRLISHNKTALGAQASSCLWIAVIHHVKATISCGEEVAYR
jgi:hypothetical protein